VLFTASPYRHVGEVRRKHFVFHEYVRSWMYYLVKNGVKYQ